MNAEHHSLVQLETDKAFAQNSVLISGMERLRFAKQALCVLGLVCISVFVAYALSPQNPALVAIFEFLKIGILPLITLVVSFYFSSRERG